ncbi:hypothetical protein LUZ61_004846 [Rhynchospora tenuis]|uniref:DUF7890 domain-containing protein n=1 Tax=Rhynchospora tenuis TaxID=198213 RepID=A0AAD6EU25_9POAL|nr:hypothetical protein LUZ61_004846 [Rhynchospora tenuis]
MGNFLPSLVHCTNVPTTPSNLAKQKLHCYTVVLSRLYKFKRSKISSNHTIDPNTKEDSSRATTTKDEETKVGQEKGVIRVKVLLTKKEAAQLLSMSVKGDKTIGQIMSELKKMDVHEKSFCSRNGAWRPVLESIPEELVEIAQ